MFIDYTTKVLETYEQMLATNELPFLLTHLTPGHVKQQCINSYRDSYDRRDEKMLKDFFGPETQQRNYRQLIEKCHINKFRPLINFLRRQSQSTDYRNVELLAWLIDFQPRPFNDQVSRTEVLHTLIPNPLPNSTKEDKLEHVEVEVELVPENEEVTIAPHIEIQKQNIRPRQWIRFAAMLAIIVSTLIVLKQYRVYNMPPMQTNKGLPDIVDNKNAASAEIMFASNLKRCHAVTKKGTQCKRPANETGFCWQHDGVE